VNWESKKAADEGREVVNSLKGSLSPQKLADLKRGGGKKILKEKWVKLAEAGKRAGGFVQRKSFYRRRRPRYQEIEE